MSLKIKNSKGGTVAEISNNWELSPGADPVVTDWFAHGVPTLIGTSDGAEIRESVGYVKVTDDPVDFNLALLDACESRDWDVVEGD